MAQSDFRRNIFYRHFDLPANFPVIGLLGDSWTSHPEPLTRMHFHNCMEIGVLYEGRGQMHIGDQALPFEAPCVVIAPPNAPHAHIVSEGCTCRWNWLYVEPQSMLPDQSPRIRNQLIEYQRCLNGDRCIISGSSHPDVLNVLHMIIHEMETTQTHYHQIVRSLFNTLFLLLLREHAGLPQPLQQAGGPLGAISPAISYIAGNYMEELTIEKLSRLCHLSYSHFRRLFKKQLGWSPLDYVQMVRIDRACVLLYNCDNSITKIALQVGYRSVSSFNRHFHRIHGISPNQWRQRMRSEDNPVVTEYFNSLPPSSFQFFPVDYQEDS